MFAAALTTTTVFVTFSVVFAVFPFMFAAAFSATVFVVANLRMCGPLVKESKKAGDEPAF